ncbi:MAG TPA: hypothetical protein VJ508_17475, partial [Saprospiraceae bacterium]|nr:hypothetical protein [Saprospiraceae bacterium]
MQKWYLVFVLYLGSLLIGCLGDNVEVEVKPRIVLQPPYVKFKAEPPGDLVAQWGPSPTDTQMNFKGYYIELYTSIDAIGDIDDIIDTIARAHAPKSDTSYVFKDIPPGRYTLQVWGERYPDPANPDSLALSNFPSIYSFTFDPTPVLAPTTLLAHSDGQGHVTITWPASPSVTQLGLAGYIIGYRDNTSSTSLIYRIRPPLSGLGPFIYGLQFPTTSDAIEVPYKIWVKSVRNDSTESADSAVIVWSGARALGLIPATITIGKKFFIGQTNNGYEIKELDDPKAQIAVSAVDSTITVEALVGAKFAKRIDVTRLDTVFFSTPMP